MGAGWRKESEGEGRKEEGEGQRRKRVGVGGALGGTSQSSEQEHG